jgi:hypothetical protein
VAKVQWTIDPEREREAGEKGNVVKVCLNSTGPESSQWLAFVNVVIGLRAV